MASKHPKFTGRKLTDDNHKSCVNALGSLYARFIEPLLQDTDLYARGRLHPDPVAPCVYVFRDRDLYETEKRGILLHIQDTKNGQGVEIVFRRNKRFVPLNETDWQVLGPERWQPNEPRWRALTISSESDIAEGRSFLQKAIEHYDKTFN